jgi:hypothetical protein
VMEREAKRVAKAEHDKILKEVEELRLIKE